MEPVRIVFMGTAPFARPSLTRLADSGLGTIAGVVTQPDRPKGRGLRVEMSAVKEEALRLGLSLLQPSRARDPEFLAALSHLEPDLIVVAAFGQILPQTILSLPRFGCLNVHGSLLPKYRGAAPIQWALLDGETETGVTIMQMDAGLDTGDVLTQSVVPIQPEDDAQILHDRLATAGAALLERTIPARVTGAVKGRPQPEEGASYARKIVKEDGRLDWKEPATALWNRMRAFHPWPGAFCFLTDRTGKKRMLKVQKAEPSPTMGAPGTVVRVDPDGVTVGCGEGALVLRRVQLEGGRPLPISEFLLGHSIRPGQTLE